MIVQCKLCQRDFDVPLWRIKQRKGKFCSPKCFHTSRQKRIVKLCLTCKRDFYVKSSRKSTAKYCSVRCYSRRGINNSFWNKKHSINTRNKMALIWKDRIAKGYIPKNKQNIYKNCVICNKKFKVIKYTLYKYNCCSKKCSNMYRSLYLRGEKSANWIDGRSYFPYPPEFNKFLKKKIKDRDGNVCKNCGSKESLSVHHINYNKFDYSESNLITLCVRCNSRANSNREYWLDTYKSKFNHV